jgi:succinoglycan biosynthesis protein ExoA
VDRHELVPAIDTGATIETSADISSSAAARPRVSVIVPARNEEEHIEACVRSILGQDADGGLEVIVADGNSRDQTAAVARRAGAVVVPNSGGNTPAGLNAALAYGRGDIVVRFDAHAEMSPGYVAACLRALDRERGPACVGGWRRVAGRGPWGHATAAALASRFGVGNPRLWRAPAAGEGPREVDTVALGCWPAEQLRAIGGWDERYVRNQDFELNHRLRRAGGRVVFDPQIWSIYKPRESPAAIARQYWQYGRYKAQLLAEEPRSLRARQLAPIGLLTATALAVLPSGARGVARLGLAAYAATLAGVAARTTAGWRTATVLVTMHVTWGAGLAAGIAELGANRLRVGAQHGGENG